MAAALFASVVLAVIANLFFGTLALAQQDLAKQLANPLASLTSVPFQFNYDSNIGPNREGDGLRINVQPVIPFKLDSNWTLISRTIVPVIYQNDVAPNSGTQFGLAILCKASSFRPLRCHSGVAQIYSGRRSGTSAANGNRPALNGA